MTQPSARTYEIRPDTPARNEKAFIEKTLASMLKQTILPERWLLLTMDLPTIPQRLLLRFRMKSPGLSSFDANHGRAKFRGQSLCIQRRILSACNRLNLISSKFGRDISFEPDYFEFLVNKFNQFPKLGIAGTPMREAKYVPLKDSFIMKMTCSEDRNYSDELA